MMLRNGCQTCAGLATGALGGMTADTAIPAAVRLSRGAARSRQLLPSSRDHHAVKSGSTFATRAYGHVAAGGGGQLRHASSPVRMHGARAGAPAALAPWLGSSVAGVAPQASALRAWAVGARLLSAEAEVEAAGKADWYAVLGVARDASEEDIKAAYRELGACRFLPTRARRGECRNVCAADTPSPRR